MPFPESSSEAKRSLCSRGARARPRGAKLAAGRSEASSAVSEAEKGRAGAGAERIASEPAEAKRVRRGCYSRSVSAEGSHGEAERTDPAGRSEASSAGPVSGAES